VSYLMIHHSGTFVSGVELGCALCLLMASFFQEEKFHPSCFPMLSDDFFNCISVIRAITDLADLLGVRDLFVDDDFR